MDLVSLSEHLNLTEFSKLLKRSNLTVELEGQGPYTVFAPNNEAFKNLSTDVEQSLAQNPQQLQKLLEYHVIKGNILGWQMRNNMMLTTLSMGNKLQVKTSAYIWWRKVSKPVTTCHHQHSLQQHYHYYHSHYVCVHACSTVHLLV